MKDELLENAKYVSMKIFFSWRIMLMLLQQSLMRLSGLVIIIPTASTKLKGGGILVSPCPSVRLSVCGQNRVRSVSLTILVGPISYLHILSCNLSRCVAYNVCFKIKKMNFGEFFEFVTLTLSSSDLGSNMTH